MILVTNWPLPLGTGTRRGGPDTSAALIAVFWPSSRKAPPPRSARRLASVAEMREKALACAGALYGTPGMCCTCKKRTPL